MVLLLFLAELAIFGNVTKNRCHRAFLATLRLDALTVLQVGIKALSLSGVYNPKLLGSGTSSDSSRKARVRIGACAAAAMPTPQPVEIHHSPNARFQSGNRVYRIVILGQGGVGKSGERGGSGVCRRHFFPG